MDATEPHPIRIQPIRIGFGFISPQCRQAFNVYAEFVESGREGDGAGAGSDYCRCCESLPVCKIVLLIHVVAVAWVIDNRIGGLRGINFCGLPV